MENQPPTARDDTQAVGADVPVYVLDGRDDEDPLDLELDDAEFNWYLGE